MSLVEQGVRKTDKGDTPVRRQLRLRHSEVQAGTGYHISLRLINGSMVGTNCGTDSLGKCGQDYAFSVRCVLDVSDISSK